VKLGGFQYTLSNILTDESPNKKRVSFRAKKILEGIVYDTVALEDNPFTFPEVKTLLDGITVGGHKLSDEKQVLNQIKSWKKLFAMTGDNTLVISKENFCRLHALVAEEEALEWGKFRDGPVTIAGTEYVPPSANILDDLFDEVVAVIAKIENPHERAIVFFLFGSLSQFFWDGNKRISRLMMNGILLSHGYDVINISATKKLEFNQKMIRFYDSLDATEMIHFMVQCSLDSSLRVD